MNEQTRQVRDAEKKILRKQMRRLREENISENTLPNYAKDIIAKMGRYLEEDSSEKVLCTYYSVGAEVPTKALISYAQSLGIPVWIPRVIGARTMIFLPFTKDCVLTPGFAGIPEPILPSEGEALQEELFASGKNILFLVPGLAFDNNYNRLGYGGGFYDVYLNRFSQKGMEHVTTIGLAYDFQMIENVPCCDYDYPVSKLMILSTKSSLKEEG